MSRLSLALLIVPLAIACTDDEVDTSYEIPDANYELDADIEALYSGAEFSDEISEADFSSVDCADGEWTFSTDVQGSASEVMGMWWDLRDQTTGPAFSLASTGGSGFAGTVSTTDMQLECDQPVLFVLIPVGDGGMPGVADVFPHLGEIDNAIWGSGFSSVNTTGSMDVQAEDFADKATVHVLNPYIPYYWGPAEMEATSSTAWSLEVELTDDLAALSFDAVWIGFAALENGKLVGLGGV